MVVIRGHAMMWVLLLLVVVVGIQKCGHDGEWKEAEIL